MQFKAKGRKGVGAYMETYWAPGRCAPSTGSSAARGPPGCRTCGRCAQCEPSWPLYSLHHVPTIPRAGLHTVLSATSRRRKRSGRRSGRMSGKAISEHSCCKNAVGNSSKSARVYQRKSGHYVRSGGGGRMGDGEKHGDCWMKTQSCTAPRSERRLRPYCRSYWAIWRLIS